MEISELKVKEHSLYKIKVKITENNVEHNSYLFTGFTTGGYCYVYNNTYEYPVKIQDVFSIKIIKKLD